MWLAGVNVGIEIFKGLLDLLGAVGMDWSKSSGKYYIQCDRVFVRLCLSDIYIPKHHRIAA